MTRFTTDTEYLLTDLSDNSNYDLKVNDNVVLLCQLLNSMEVKLILNMV